MDRWREDGRGFDATGRLRTMTQAGLDVARGGRDNTVLAKRYGKWVAPLELTPGAQVPSVQHSAAIALMALREGGRIFIDATGLGAGVYDLVHERAPKVTSGIVFSAASFDRDRSGQLEFVNLRSQAWWKLREALDPERGDGLALPPDPELRADLTAPRWQLRSNGVLVESREDIIKRIGRSPDKGTALLLAVMAPDPREIWSQLYGQEMRMTRGEQQKPSQFGPVSEEIARLRAERRQQQAGIRRIR
jgi:hypothetical protein